MSSFHHNTPRPPVVPGEETEGVSSTVQPVGVSKLHNPALTPRTSSLYQHSISDGVAPLGFEPEGKSGTPDGGLSPSGAPGYLRWARNLHALLSDSEGVNLFKSYLLQEGRQHADPLDFWFACEGLRKQSDPDLIAQYVKVIYRRFFLKTQLRISDSLRSAVHHRLKDTGRPLDASIFEDTQNEVERLITETTYPNFLRSEIYLSHVQSMQNGPSNSGSHSSGENSSSNGGMPPTALATLHEDKELEISTQPTTTSYPPLTKDMLIMTQKRRVVDLRPKPEAFAGIYLHGKNGPKAYSSYNPVSRQDSELQSLSSDARTESDNLSLTDSSIDGMSLGHHRMTRKQFQRHCRQVKEAASLNRDPYMHQTVIPRTQRIQKEQVHPMKPEDFAAILIEKLETVKRNQEAQEKLAHKLFEGEGMDGGAPAKSLADAIRERFQIIDDDNDQDILDQHVSRVWSDLTPARTPGIASPRPKSPDILRRNRPSNQAMTKVCVSGGATMAPHMNVSQGHHGVVHPYQARPYQRHVRKDKDVFSTFSSDSGNVHDFSEVMEHKLHLPKSKSMPDSTDTYSSLPSHDSRFRQSREWCGSNRRHSKKPELTDSGVSVVSETVSHHGSQTKERILSWLMENNNSGCCAHSERDSASSCSGGSRFETKHHTRPNPLRGRRSPPPGPAQPFVADPCMPPLPSPHTPTQLEEARRRLEDQARAKQCRQRCQAAKTESSLSGSSTLRKGGLGKPTDSYTTVVFSFCDEQFPYRSKIPGHSITLKQFKEFLPKKGNYRYFFKTECEELDMRVIQEEITDDSEILPLWEGKVMAQVKPIE